MSSFRYVERDGVRRVNDGMSRGSGEPWVEKERNVAASGPRVEHRSRLRAPRTRSCHYHAHHCTQSNRPCVISTSPSYTTLLCMLTDWLGPIRHSGSFQSRSSWPISWLVTVCLKFEQILRTFLENTTPPPSFWRSPSRWTFRVKCIPCLKNYIPSTTNDNFDIMVVQFQ